MGTRQKIKVAFYGGLQRKTDRQPRTLKKQNPRMSRVSRGQNQRVRNINIS